MAARRQPSAAGLALAPTVALAVALAAPGGPARATDAAADTSPVAPAASAADPAALVAGMSRALRTLNYEGTFVHLQGTHASSMRILHANVDGGELERMTSLDGEAREVVRDHSLVTCVWPDSRSVVISESKPRKLLPSIDVSLGENSSYTLVHEGEDRVAGRATEVVGIRPADRYRYGHRFWIDRDTGMLLRSMLLDGSRAVEQVLFTAIDYPDSIPPERFELVAEGERLSWVEPASAEARAGLVPGGTSGGVGGGEGGAEGSGRDGEGGGERIVFEGLPAGYAELSETYRPMPFGDAPVSHVMLSDGMASVSVYVEYVAAAEQDSESAGLASMGAVNAFGLGLEEGFVTVVGEVPEVTVRTIAEAVRLAR